MWSFVFLMLLSIILFPKFLSEVGHRADAAHSHNRSNEYDNWSEKVSDPKVWGMACELTNLSTSGYRDPEYDSSDCEVYFQNITYESVYSKIKAAGVDHVERFMVCWGMMAQLGKIVPYISFQGITLDDPTRQDDFLRFVLWYSLELYKYGVDEKVIFVEKQDVDRVISSDRKSMNFMEIDETIFNQSKPGVFYWTPMRSKIRLNGITVSNLYASGKLESRRYRIGLQEKCEEWKESVVNHRLENIAGAMTGLTTEGYAFIRTTPKEYSSYFNGATFSSVYSKIHSSGVEKIMTYMVYLGILAGEGVIPSREATVGISLHTPYEKDLLRFILWYAQELCLHGVSEKIMFVKEKEIDNIRFSLRIGELCVEVDEDLLDNSESGVFFWTPMRTSLNKHTLNYIDQVDLFAKNF